MSSEAIERLKQTATTILANRQDLSEGYMGELLDKAIAFCGNFGMNSDEVVDNLNNLLVPSK